MTRKLLESYQSNKRLVERNKKKIEDASWSIPSSTEKVAGSSHEFPYIPQRFTVQSTEQGEAQKAKERIRNWEKEIERQRQEMKEVEQFINKIEGVKDREIFTYRYIDGLKAVQVAEKVGYSKGRISQIISKYLED